MDLYSTKYTLAILQMKIWKLAKLSNGVQFCDCSLDLHLRSYRLDFL